jgi:hypothetical protein
MLRQLIALTVWQPNKAFDQSALKMICVFNAARRLWSAISLGAEDINYWLM